MVAITVLTLWSLADGPLLAASKLLSNSQQAFRDAKMQQDADRRATELLRQQILASTAAKFAQKERSNPRTNVNNSWNQRYRNTASKRQQ
jgi:hypothetical protein